VDAVGKVNESAAAWRVDFIGSPKRVHAFQHGKGNAGTHCPEGMSAIN
jgi:hypothetical protein